MNFEYQLGFKAKDKVTDLEGIIISRAEWLTGCNTYCLKPKAKDGKELEGQWVDEGRIEIIGPGITKDEVKAKKNGGPISTDSPRA